MGVVEFERHESVARVGSVPPFLTIFAVVLITSTGNSWWSVKELTSSMRRQNLPPCKDPPRGRCRFSAPLRATGSALYGCFFLRVRQPRMLLKEISAALLEPRGGPRGRCDWRWLQLFGVADRSLLISPGIFHRFAWHGRWHDWKRHGPRSCHTSVSFLAPN